MTTTSTEIVVLVGIPGSGKSTLAKKRFSNYTRINLDNLRSRRNENIEILKCLEKGESLVIDNTNSTRKSRIRYIEASKLFGIPIHAIYLDCPLELALRRNALRETKEYVPDRAVKMYNRILEIPTVEEGFESIEVLEP
ncbi:MAG: AAA family ATPase [Nitrososphaerales archaeon]